MKQGKNILVCVWLPCSGKWTQSRILAEKIRAYRIESWARLDMIIRGEIYPEMQEVAQLVRTRPQELSHKEKDDLLMAQIGDISQIQEETIVLDWFVRTFPQYNILCDIFWREQLNFLLFHITAKNMYMRAEMRWIDPNTRESFSSISSQEADERWLIKRESDTPEVLRKRQVNFDKKTKWVLKAHEDRWWRVIEINAGHPNPQDVTRDMMVKIWKVFPKIFD